MFDPKLVNKVTSAKGTDLNYRSGPGTKYTALFNAKPGVGHGRTTGEKVAEGTNWWYQVVLNQAGGKTAWVRSDVTRLTEPTTDTVKPADGDSLVNNLVKSDEKVFNTLLRLAPIVESLKTRGATVDKYTGEIKKLYDRLSVRQNRMKTSNILKWQSGINSSYQKLQVNFKTWVFSQFGYSIGAVPVAAVIVGAVVGAGLSVAAYYAFKPSYDESQVDLKISTDLEKALTTLSPAKAQAVKADLEQQVDTAYNQGKTDGKFSNLLSMVKGLAIVGVSYYVIDRFIINRKKK